MKCLIADDEPLILKDIKRTVLKVLGEDTLVFEAGNSDEVMDILGKYSIPIVFLDIEMPVINGLELAEKIREIRPRTNIIFVTGYEKYALDVLEMYVSGFIMKPVNEKSMNKALQNLRFPVPRLTVRCFGHFEVLYDGKPVDFKRSQSKEVFAYLVDKGGAFVSEDELRFILWSESEDTEKKRRYVRNIISDIRTAFKVLDVEDVIINNNKSGYAVNPGKISCDLYDLQAGRIDRDNIDTERYMEQYTWSLNPEIPKNQRQGES